ncbi:Forkhead-associated protein [[Leptolyngbya] sp. PCC 7376]|uniref:FHA domain-containing protein n=1 Tax=[Leptolyngbya] sp. PCC 7376 TaxID=111781 RepID=UPI00029F0945|nr:FHA domain-containing protein [[Leptolyngbya] sp. PCC 7376]AFY39218.1 Forkhead-associated protein [[Leptolyngbya] sp. PCC 7376]
MVVASNSRKYNHYLIVNDDQGEREYTLTESKYTLGRKSDCSIALDSHFVSRLHATLLRCLHNDGQSYYRLLDGDGYQQTSANGIIVNGKKVTAYELKHDDKIIFGPQVYAVYRYREVGEMASYGKIAKEEDPFDITLIDPAMIDEDMTLGGAIGDVDTGNDNDDVSTQLLDTSPGSEEE